MNGSAIEIEEPRFDKAFFQIRSVDHWPGIHEHRFHVVQLRLRGSIGHPTTLHSSTARADSVDAHSAKAVPAVSFLWERGKAKRDTTIWTHFFQVHAAILKLIAGDQLKAA